MREQKDGFLGMIDQFLREQGWSSPINAMQFFPGISFGGNDDKFIQFTAGRKLIDFYLPRAIRLRTVAPYSMRGSSISST